MNRILTLAVVALAALPLRAQTFDETAAIPPLVDKALKTRAAQEAFQRKEKATSETAAALADLLESAKTKGPRRDEEQEAERARLTMALESHLTDLRALVGKYHAHLRETQREVRTGVLGGMYGARDTLASIRDEAGRGLEVSLETAAQLERVSALVLDDAPPALRRSVKTAARDLKRKKALLAHHRDRAERAGRMAERMERMAEFIDEALQEAAARKQQVESELLFVRGLKYEHAVESIGCLFRAAACGAKPGGGEGSSVSRQLDRVMDVPPGALDEDDSDPAEDYDGALDYLKKNASLNAKL